MKYNVEGLREEIRNALLVVPRTKGQLDGFDTYGSSRVAFTRKAQRDITTDDGVRITSTDAEVVRTIACRTFKQSPMPLPPQAFQFSRMVKAMHTAPEHISDWLHYCYSDGAQVPSVPLLKALLNQFYDQETQRLAGKSQTLIKHLAHLACQQKRVEISAGPDLLTQSYIAQLCGKSTSAWKNIWASRWKRLMAILDQFDREGLDHVYECSKRQKSARKHSVLLLQPAFSFTLRAGVSAGVAV